MQVGLDLTPTVTSAGSPMYRYFKEFTASAVTSTALPGSRVFGNGWHFFRLSPYIRDYRFYGPDQTSDTEDDTIVRYTFDHTGKTVNIVTYN